MAAVQWDRLNALTVGDRDFFSCAQDRVWGTDGKRIDREDRSILAGTNLAGCNSANLYANTIIQLSNSAIRYVPSPDGSTVGPFPGYRPRPRPTPTYANGGTAYYQDVLNYPFFHDQEVINQRERASFYGATDFSFDSFNWKTQFLYNRRETKAHSWRQFYPTVYNEAEDDYFQTIMPFPSDQKVTIDYFYGTTKFDGQFKSTDSWSWEVNAGYSRSRGKYSALSIDVDRAGDLNYTEDDMPVNYFDPGFLSGARMNELIAAVGQWHTGKTTYEQASANAIFSGNLFKLPAGDVASAFGVEFRHYKINDTPSDFALADRSWNSTSAGVTRDPWHGQGQGSFRRGGCAAAERHSRHRVALAQPVRSRIRVRLGTGFGPCLENRPELADRPVTAHARHHWHLVPRPWAV